MRLRYMDDEGNYVNIDYGDESGYKDMWTNAVSVQDREYKRIKLKASELNSPYLNEAATRTRRNSNRLHVDTGDIAEMYTDITHTANRDGIRKQLDMVSHSNEVLSCCATTAKRPFSKIFEY